MRAWIAASLLLMATAAVAQEVKQVDGADLAIGTKKYDGKMIEVGAKCYFADVDDYRCTTEASYSIFTKRVEPDEQRKFLEENCDTLKKAFLGGKCAVKLRFKYDAGNTKEDIVSGYQTRRVSHPESVVVMRRQHRLQEDDADQCNNLHWTMQQAGLGRDIRLGTLQT